MTIRRKFCQNERKQCGTRWFATYRYLSERQDGRYVGMIWKKRNDFGRIVLERIGTAECGGERGGVGGGNDPPASSMYVNAIEHDIIKYSSNYVIWNDAISHQQVSCLCLIDISTAFDTLDHSVLLHRLYSWFVISFLSFQSFTSHLSSRISSTAIPPNISPSSPVSFDVPQGSVLGPILLNLCTTPLSSFISSSTLSRLLYINDSKLFISFMCHLWSHFIRDVIKSLNSSKTKFLLIRIPQLTSKIINPTLSLLAAQLIPPTPSAKISVSSFTLSSLAPSKSPPSPALVNTTFVNSAVFGTPWIL